VSEKKIRIFEHSEVTARDEKELIRIRVRRNHTELQKDRVHVKELFIIREQITGHTVRI
jgi:hypothetical protein